jgi:hydrogenase maturation factor
MMAQAASLRIDASDPAEALATASLMLARRFAAGATMWCVAPEWSSHGRHVAVEFVHPVIVGKRALPAMYVEAPDATGALRLLARAGDVLLILSAGDEPGVHDLMQRSEAWGLVRLWLGAGPRPQSDCCDQLIWLETTASDPANSGDLVMLYHLLWELTHVVFEHPGLLEPDSCDAGEVCITCSDEGRVAEVTLVHDETRVDVVTQGRPETIDASLIEPVEPGDLVLVHAGVALTALTTLTGGMP